MREVNRNRRCAGLATVGSINFSIISLLAARCEPSIPSFDAVDTDIVALVGLGHNRSSPSYQIPHSAITVKQCACWILHIATLVWIGSNGVAEPEMRKTLPGFRL